MLTLVGLGLCDGTDITVRGKRTIEEAQHIYLENYTSLLQCTHEELEEELNSTIRLLDRNSVELDIDKILHQAKQENIVILVIGDPFGATTHADLALRARKEGVEVQVVHNASIMNAVGEVGLELYRYGRTVSIPYWGPGFEPTSFLDAIKENLDRGLHTLCLLDIKADEKRFMSIAEGLAHLLKAEAVRKHGIVTQQRFVVGVARLGAPDQIISAGPLTAIASTDFGSPPHCIIIPGKLHPIEEEMLAITQKE